MINPLKNSPCSNALFRRLERYLLSARWGVIIAAAAISGFEGFPGGSLVPVLPLWGIFFLLNLFLSVYIWKREPFYKNKAALLLSIDLLQTTLILLLTGGYRSAFFVFTLLLAAEIGIVFSWNMGVSLLVGSGVWFSAINVLGQTNDLQAYAAYVVVSKFATFLVVGILVSALSEQLRREKAACQKANTVAERMKNLNALFFRLGESHFDIQRTLNTVIENASTLPQVLFTMALLPAEEKDTWEVIASNLEKHPKGEKVELLDLEKFSHCIGTECPDSLLRWLGSTSQTDLLALSLSAAPKRSGYLLIGYPHYEKPDEETFTYLQSLAQETNLALRNAQLYTQEMDHIEKMQRFERLQATFFSAISHELKTPLSVLKMLMPSLTQLSNLPDSVQAEVLESVSHNLDRLEVLIGDLLESARLEVGSVQIRPRHFSLYRHLEEIFSDLSPLAEGKEQFLESKLSENDLMILADPTRFDQILSNLLLNAIKFSPTRGKIRVTVETGKAEVQICVLDEGPGVPAEDRQQIFDKFYVVKEQKALSGVGLGLFICRELVRLHGGRIWVEDRSQGGSQFCFTLPNEVSNEKNLNN